MRFEDYATCGFLLFSFSGGYDRIKLYRIKETPVMQLALIVEL